MSPFKVMFLLSLAFGAGYMIGNSSNDELKKLINNFIDKFEKGSEKMKTLVMELIETTEDMNPDILKANIEKIISYAVEKVDEFSNK